MSYTSNKAPGRKQAADRILDEAGTQPSQSNQERQQPQSAKVRSVDTSGSKYNVGNQVRTKDSVLNQVGLPSSVALEGRDKTEGAVQNPDGQRNRPGTSRK